MKSKKLIYCHWHFYLSKAKSSAILVISRLRMNPRVSTVSASLQYCSDKSQLPQYLQHMATIWKYMQRLLMLCLTVTCPQALINA